MKIKNLVFLFCVFSFIFINNEIVLAQTNYKGVRVPTKDELKISDKSIGATINDIIGFVLSAVFGLSVLMIVVGGVMYITSGGERDRTETAQDIITWAIVGLIISLIGYAVVVLISGALGAGGGFGSSGSGSNSSVIRI